MPAPGTVATPIPTPVVFPYEPSGPMTVNISYPTNVLRSYNDTEKRIPLRVTPLLQIRWTVMALDTGESGRLAGLLYTNPQNRWYVPLWPSARVASAVSQIAAPTAPSATAVGSGGTFAAGTYYWKIAATTAASESLPTAEVSATLVLNGSATIGWAAVAGATGYKIYRGTAAGAESLYFAVGAVTSFTDTGAAGTAGTVVTSAQTAYTVDLTNTEFVVGNNALVWKDSQTYDLMTVVSTPANTVTLSGTTSFTHTANAVYVVPILVGSLPDHYGQDRYGIGAVFPVTFDCDTTGMPAPTVNAETAYKGYPVAMGILNTKLGGTEGWSQSSERVGPETGMFVWRNKSPSAVIGRELHAICSTKAEIASLRSFLYSRKGRAMPAWIGSGQYDFQLAASYPATAQAITISGVAFGVFYLGTNGRTHLTLTPSEGVVLPVTVTSVTAAGTGLLTLNLDRPIGAAVDISCPVSFLALARLTDDAIDLEYLTPDVAVCRIPFTDLPRETPA